MSEEMNETNSARKRREPRDPKIDISELPEEGLTPVQRQMLAFKKFLKAEYLKWASTKSEKSGNIPSETAFATQYLGVTQSSWSSWVSLTRPPSLENLDRVATRLGPRVYEIFNLPARIPSDPLARYVFYNWHKLSTAKKKEIAERIKNELEEGDEDEDRSAGPKGAFAANSV